MELLISFTRSNLNLDPEKRAIKLIKYENSSLKRTIMRNDHVCCGFRGYVIVSDYGLKVDPHGYYPWVKVQFISTVEPIGFFLLQPTNLV